MSTHADADADANRSGRTAAPLPGRSGTRVEIVTARPRAWACGDEIDALLARTGAPASARWSAVMVWLNNHPDMRPLFVLVRREGRLVAAALIGASLRPGRVSLETVGNPKEPGWLPCDPGDPDGADAATALAEALDQALRELGRPWFLALHNLPVDDMVVAALRKVLPASQALPASQVPRLQLQQRDRLDRYLSRNTRSAVSRARKRIDAAGLRCEIAWTDAPAVIEASLPEILDLHRRRNLQLRERSLLDDPMERALFTDTLRSQADAGRARVLTVRLDGALAAFAICFETGGNLWVYSNMASPDWLDYSPGTIANAEVVRAAFENPAVGCVDWGAGLQRYKLSADAKVAQLQHLRAWSSSASRLGWRACQFAKACWRRLLATAATASPPAPQGTPHRDA